MKHVHTFKLAPGSGYIRVADFGCAEHPTVTDGIGSNRGSVVVSVPGDAATEVEVWSASAGEVTGPDLLFDGPIEVTAGEIVITNDSGGAYGFPTPVGQRRVRIHCARTGESRIVVTVDRSESADPPGRRSFEELVDVEPYWPTVQEWVTGSTRTVEILPADHVAARRCLLDLQVTAGSVLGALALNTSGIRLDHGWLRLYGSSTSAHLDLAAVNGLSSHQSTPPALLVVATDVLGGRFAINGGGLPGDIGKTCYFAPETLEWEPLDMPNSQFVRWALNGPIEEFYAPFRWDGWEQDVEEIPVDYALAFEPSLFAAGSEQQLLRRFLVPWSEVVEQQERDAGR